MKDPQVIWNPFLKIPAFPWKTSHETPHGIGQVHKILAYVQDHWVYVSEIFLLYTPTINPICLDTTVNVYIHPHTPISPMLNFIHLYHKSIFHSHLVGEICTVYTNIVSYIPGTIPQTNWYLSDNYKENISPSRLPWFRWPIIRISNPWLSICRYRSPW